MTLTIDAIDHWTRIQPEQARDPLLTEMATASVAAVRETDPMRQAFHTGLFTGYAVGFGLVTREALDRARRTPWSSNVHVDFWRPSTFADTDTAWACGVRHGYYLATSERPDADDCLMCGERLIEALDDITYCDDGAFCGIDDCRRLWHANGPTTCGGEE
jgi:hypothetical protein